MRIASLFAALFLTLLSLAPSLQDGQTSNAPSCCAVSCTAEAPASEEPGDPCDGMACNPMMICGTCAWLPTPGEALQVKESEGTAVQNPVVIQLASTAAVADFWQPPQKG